jgi:hypothetical protein
MKRTLRNMITTSMIIGELLLTGCIEKKIKEVINYPAKTTTGEEDAYTQALNAYNNLHSIATGNAVRINPEEARKIELKNYFFKGKELEFISPSKEEMEYDKNDGWWVSKKGKNLEIITGEELKINGKGSDTFNIIGGLVNFIGQGEYSLPSGEKVMLTVFNYKSPEIAKRTADSIAVNLNFLKGDTLVWVDKPELWKYLQPRAMLEEDKKVFSKAISHYLNRTKMELVFNNSKIKQQINDLLFEYSNK